MTKQKVGLVLFWIGVIFLFGWLVVGWTIGGPAYRNLTSEEIKQTIWAIGALGNILASITIPLGGLLAGIGALLYSGAKGSTVWKFGIGIFLAFIIANVVGILGHFSPLFGIGGTLILLSFTGILWLWARERMTLEGSSKSAADFKLVGYVFMLMAAWFMCGVGSVPFWKAFEGQAPMSPIGVMILLALGWVFLFLGYNKSRKQQG